MNILYLKKWLREKDTSHTDSPKSPVNQIKDIDEGTMLADCVTLQLWPGQWFGFDWVVNCQH